MMKGLNEGYGQNAKKQRLLIVASAGALALLTGGALALTPATTPSHTAPAHATVSGAPTVPGHAVPPAHAAAPAHPAASAHAAPPPPPHPVAQARPAPPHAIARMATTPRMLENGAPFSFADLVERVSPAVVTVTVEQQMKQQSFNPEELPEPFRDFFNQFGGSGGGGRRGFSMPRKAVAMGSGFVIDRSGAVSTAQDGGSELPDQGVISCVVRGYGRGNLRKQRKLRSKFDVDSIAAQQADGIARL